MAADNTIRQDMLRQGVPDDSVDPTGYPAGATTVENEFDAIVAQIRNILGSADWRSAPTSTLAAAAAHIADLANPHATSIANIGSGVLAQLNAAITDATLDDAASPRDPNPHAASHENGGADEIDVAGLSGLLANAQNPLPHGSTHEDGGGDELDVTGLSGLLADGQTPLVHAEGHVEGPDQIDGDRLDIDWNPANYTPDSSIPEATDVNDLSAHLKGIDTVLGATGPHAATHVSGGSDEIDGDTLDIDWNPSNYTPATTPPQVTSIDELTAHLYGIDQALGATGPHAATHISGGGDEIDGDRLDVDFTPSNYTPDTTPPEVTLAVELTAHLAGIDTVLAGPFTPATHASTHENGGGDEIDVGGLSGLLADSQTPLAHASGHISGGADEVDGDQLDIDWNPTNYTPATTPTEVTSVDHLTAHLYGIDQVLAGPFIPAAHASTHENGGADEIDVGGLSGLLADAQTPLSHASTHVSGGADEIDGDVLDIDWNPSNYTPATTPTEVTSIDELTAHLYGIDQALGTALGLTMQDVYDNTGGVPHVVLVAGQPFTLRDAVSTIGDVFRLQDGTGTDFFNIDSAQINFGPPTRRVHEINDPTDSFGGIRYMPDGGTITSATGKQGMLQWDSTITSNIPGGAPLGNDTAPGMCQSIGEIIFESQPLLLSSSLLFNQATTVTTQGFNIGPIYTMVHQPLIRVGSVGGSRSCSQMNAVRAQPRIGPNVAGDLTQTSIEMFYCFAQVNATVGTVGCTKLTYLMAKNPTLTAGGTIGTLNVVEIEAIAGPTNVYGINSSLAAAANRRLIRHIGTAQSDFGGLIGLGSGATVDWTIGRVAANIAGIGTGDSLRIPTGSLQFGATGDAALSWVVANVIGLAAGDSLRTSSTGQVQFLDASAYLSAVASGELRVEAVKVGFGMAPASANWVYGFVAPAATITVGGDWANLLNSPGANHTIDAALATFTQWTVNAPAGTLGTGSVVEAACMLIQTAPSLGTERYGLHVTSNPSGGTTNRCARFEGAAGVQIDGVLTHLGSTLGFYGATPVTRPTYTPTNVTTDRSFDANATTLDELADVVGTLIADLQAVGLAA